jgi:hypothetical protein
MVLSRFLLWSLLLNLAGGASAWAERASIYTVQPGDTLSEIANRTFGFPIYTEAGSLEKILALNPQIVDPNLVLPGDRIILDESELPNRTMAKTTMPSDGEALNPPPNDGRAPAATATGACEAIPGEAAPAPKRYPSSEIEIAPEFKFVKLQANDTVTRANATLLSSSHFGVRGAWVQNWTPASSTYQWLSYSKTSFATPALKTLETPSFTSMSFGFGARFFQDGRNRLSTALGAEQSAYIRATSTTSVRLDPIVTPLARVQSEHDLVRIEPFRAGVGFNGEARAPGSNDQIRAKWGYGYGTALFVEQAFTASRFRTAVSYFQSKQDSSIATQTRSEIGLELNYSFTLGGASTPAK